MFYPKRRIGYFLILLAGMALWSCSPSQGPGSGKPLFTLLRADDTGVEFVNQLDFDERFNIYTYRNFYNGGGVALGDINNDGLIDIYFTANMKPNRLYLNKGNMVFEDITEKAGVAGTRSWSTGVSMADVNGDGWLDIYVCNSGNVKGDFKENELFINNGDLTFSEQAEAYGIADRGFSTHGNFFDYDNDGDLDLYMLNNSFQAIGSFNLTRNARPVRDEAGGDKLYRNDGGRFTDVSEEAGIYGSVIGFGLGVTVGDVNRDGWPDIYVSNDFFEHDYLYINNRDGTFREVLQSQMRSISAASMGADMADMNNDCWPDIFVTDMLPQPDARIKTVTTFEDWDRYSFGVMHDYYHQFTRNTLQINNGDGTFSEISRKAGIFATDWSWGALLFDLDNDGLKDIFVANGIYQDLTDQDYLQYFSNRDVLASIVSGKNVDYRKLIDAIPSNPVNNYAFISRGDYTFADRTHEYGFDHPSFSNGSAYGDLDNDGDLDLVISNVNMPCFIYRNESDTRYPDRSHLILDLKGEGLNTKAVGARVTVRYNGQAQYLEMNPIRGFQSTVDHRLHFGFDSVAVVDTVLVEWPGGSASLLTGVATNQVLVISQTEADRQAGTYDLPDPGSLPFRERSIDGLSGHPHIENDFVDFDRDRLIFHMLSTEGPAMDTADVNGDGLTDLYLGGAKDSPGMLFEQRPGGTFVRTNIDLFERDKVSEDTGCLFFDADGDGDPDLYVASGGNEFPSSSTALLDRLYFNDGRGNFTKSEQLLPTSQFISSSCVAAADVDGDGDLDLFVGERLKPFLYGMPGDGYLLINDGSGHFSDATDGLAPGLKGMGMITTAVWADIDRDGDPDLLVAGEWMSVRVFRNDGGRLSDATAGSGLEQARGWWNRLVPADLDGDGDIDFIAGNHGLNSRFQATEEKPARMYIHDFDQNGTVEQILCVYNGAESYPLALRHDLIKQIPELKKKYVNYKDYKEQTIEKIFTPEQIGAAHVLEATHMASSLLINDGNGHFRLMALPPEAQFSPVYAAAVYDYNVDGMADILLGGNLYRVKPEVGRYDASYGTLLRAAGSLSYTVVPARNSGFRIMGEARNMAVVRIGGKPHLLIARNGDAIQAFALP
jgi:enediyne biosynthesis protein E4